MAHWYRMVWDGGQAKHVALMNSCREIMGGIRGNLWDMLLAQKYDSIAQQWTSMASHIDLWQFVTIVA
jgi:hypothetical protein